MKDETTVSPRYQTAQRLGRDGHWYDGVGKMPIGGTVETTHSIWRCDSCRALYVTTPENTPGVCLKCGEE